MTIAAALSVQTPVNARWSIANSRTRHIVHLPTSVATVTWLNLWAAYQKEAGERSRSQLRVVQDELPEPLRMREWVDIRRQLKSIAADRRAGHHHARQL